MNLAALGERYGTDKVWHGYIPHYERHLPEVTSLLEIGVLDGASLAMWRDAFPKARIVGLDINPRCAKPEGTEVFVGSQIDEELLNSLGEFDVVIDDGSHVNDLTIETFRILWPHTRKLYVIEDLHCTYEDAHREWPGMQYVKASMHNDRATFDAFLADLVHSVDSGGPKAVHLYPKIAMIER